MDSSLAIVIFIIILALIFDYINGFHDSANSIATIVSTQVLKPYQAVLWAAFFNFVAFLLSRQAKKRKSKMRFEWQGALKDMRTQYTSVQLQHRIAEMRAGQDETSS